MDIRLGNFNDAQVQALLKHHLEGMHANSPPGHVFALDWSGLQKPEISFYTAWQGDERMVRGMAIYYEYLPILNAHFEVYLAQQLISVVECHEPRLFTTDFVVRHCGGLASEHHRAIERVGIAVGEPQQTE